MMLKTIGKAVKRVPTIKELAKAAGVSPSTVSIVLSGKAEERKIPQTTREKVISAARALDYQLNVSARRLRSNAGHNTLVIAVFWALDYRTLWMVRFLRGLQDAIAACGKRIEIVIHSYHNDRLNESFQVLGFCNAAVICNASDKDLAFLEGAPLSVPVVLYNRHSDVFCTVNVDDASIGRIPAEIFASHGRKQAMILTSDITYSGMSVRNACFEEAAKAAGISVGYLVQSNTMQGGYLGGEALCEMTPRPDCLFCASDSLALGAMRALHKRGVAVPQEIEVVSVGNGDRDMEEYALISLSVVPLPMEKMARECLHLVLDILEGKVASPQSVTLPVAFHPRESTL